MDPRQTAPEADRTPDDRRKGDRRLAADPSYSGPERRRQDRRTRD